MNCTVETDGETLVVRTTRVLKQPRNMDTGQAFAYRLSRSRKHKRKWHQPEGATLILSLHFTVTSPAANVYYAEASLEIPTKAGLQYCPIVASAKNRYDALIALIGKIENSNWFPVFKEEGVCFRVTGCEMEDLYRGYL